MSEEEELSHNSPKKVSYLLEDPISQIHNLGLDYKANHIYLVSEHDHIAGSGDSVVDPGVEFAMANRFIKNMNILMRKSTNPILIHLKCAGGFVTQGMAIYGMIKSCPNHVTILNYANAESMSSIIFQAGDKRIMFPHAKFMFHQGSVSGESQTYKQYITDAEESKKDNTTMMKIYIDAMKVNGKMKKWSRKRIWLWLEEQMNKKEEVYLDAKQSVEFGFADEVFGEKGLYDWAKLLKFEE